MRPEISPRDTSRRISWLLLAAGVCLHLTTALLGEGGAAFRLGLCAWSLAPYALLAWMLRRRGAGIALMAGALLMLLLDTIAWWSVFIAPSHSTDALNLLAAPLWNLVCIAPLSLAIEAWLARKRAAIV